MNTILLIIDTLRRDHLGCYGAPKVRTPNLDAFASQAVRFENAYLGSSPCMPARREIFTGRYEFPFRGWGPLEYDDQELIGTLKSAGHPGMLVTDHYHLFEHGAGNYHFNYAGFEFIRGQENDHWITDPSIDPRFPAAPRSKCHFRWEQYMRNTAQWRDGAGRWRQEEDTFTAQTFRQATAWLEHNRALSRDGFCLTIDHFDPHEPFDPPPPYDTLYCEGEPPKERVRWPIYGPANRYSPEELADIRALYAGKVTLVDRWFGTFMARVRELGLLENTMIIVTTDHGHLFGEHGMIGKPGSGHGDSTLYQPMAHLPLLVYHPDFRSQAGTRREALVQPVDYYPTILEAMGVAARPERLHGRSLLTVLGDPAASVRSHACFGKFGEAIQVTDGRWTLAKYPPTLTENGPLNWYSVHEPLFIRPKVVQPFDRVRGCYPVEHPRGPMTDLLFDLATDPGQERNLLAERPEERSRLEQALREFLRDVGAPPEQAQRLGLEGLCSGTQCG